MLIFQGTPFFMSTEVAQHTYCHACGPRVNDQSQVYDKWSGMAQFLRRQQLAQGESPAPILASSSVNHDDPPLDLPDNPVCTPFRHNPLHDLESVLWLSLWLPLRSKLVKDNAEISIQEWNDHMTAQSDLAEQLFQDKGFRNSVMDGDFLLASHAKETLPQVRQIIRKIDVFRQSLVSRYRQVERSIHKPGYKIGFDAADGLYLPLHHRFAGIAATLEEKGLFVDFAAEPNRTSLVGDKRRRAEATTTSTLGTQRSYDDDDKPLSRVAKSRKIAYGASAGARSAPAAMHHPLSQKRSGQ